MQETTDHNRYFRDTPLLPPPVYPGDTIGLFCPAGPIRNKKHVQQGIDCLRAEGFNIKITGSLHAVDDPLVYLAASDDKRARDFSTLRQDEDVKALMAIRGGFGCLRLLEQIDFAGLRRQPKLLIGFSDVTTLLAANFRKSGMIGLHGPVVSTLTRMDLPSRQRLFALMAGNYLPFPADFTKNTIKILRPGKGKGRLIVGNLTTLVHLIGTPYEPIFNNRILVIEDTGEPMYRLDRMLTQLACCGKLQQLSGLIAGSFDNGRGTEIAPEEYDRLFERIMELTAGYDYPVWGNFPVGHTNTNFALPYGMDATMSATGELRLQPAQAPTNKDLNSGRKHHHD